MVVVVVVVVERADVKLSKQLSSSKLLSFVHELFNVRRRDEHFGAVCKSSLPPFPFPVFYLSVYPSIHPSIHLSLATHSYKSDQPRRQSSRTSRNLDVMQ